MKAKLFALMLFSPFAFSMDYLPKEISREKFNVALDEYKRINNKSGIITFVDYSIPSIKERLFVIDIENKKVLFKSLVSHGKNTGLHTAKSFSNVEGSNKSSLGVYTTADTYYGKNGYSLRLHGLSEGKNTNALQRYIVMHGAKYANPEFAAKYGYLGRSEGCFALPVKLHRNVIDKIKNGTVIYATI